jgi:hypothetical protein
MACSKGGAPAPEAETTFEAEAPPSPSKEAFAPAGSAAAGDASAPAAWTGTYKTAPGSVYVPEDWKVRWRPEDATSGLGEGALTLSIDPTGQVEGAVEGPLGPARVNGYMADGGVSATISRRDPRDHGFAGVLSGKENGDRIEGTLNVSPATGGAVRVGTFSVTPGRATAEH